MNNRKILLYLSFLWIGGYFSPLFKTLSADISYIIAAVLILLLYFLFKSPIVERINKIYISLFGIGIFLSMFVAIFIHGQTFIGTAISQRPVYFLACFFVWWRIGLTEDELFLMFRKLTYLSLLMFLGSLVAPNLFLTTEYIDNFNYSQSTTDVLCFIPGRLYVLLYFMYLIQKMLEDFRRKDLYILLAILTMFFILQNRSTIIVLAAAFIYFIWKIRKTAGIKVYPLLVLLAIFVLPYTVNIFNSLFEETQSQLEDDNYNRWVAVQFYMFDFNQGNPFQIIFGNGQPTSGGTLIGRMVAANEDGAYWSDLGFIGDWFLFGILPIISLLIMAYRVLRYDYPIYLKLRFFTFLLVPTISYFSGINVYAMTMSLIIYLVCIAEKRTKHQIYYNEIICNNC